MDSPTKHYDQNELVFEKNALVHSRQTFTLLQQKILALTIAQIKRSDEGFKTYKISIRDLAELANSENIYNQLKKETRNLTEKAVTLEINGSFKHWSVISAASHKKGSGVLEIRFDPEIRDMLFQLKGQWSASVAMELASCTSIYSIRIMKMLLSYWRKGEWQVSVDELRFKLGLENKYQDFYMFRKRVLKKAQEDLRKNTNMRFTWQEEKNAIGRGKGRKITHIKFDFSWKPNQMNLPIEEQKEQAGFDIYNLRERLKTYAKLEQQKINKIMTYLGDHPDDREEFKQRYHHIEANIQQGTDDRGKPISSASGYAWSQINPLIEK